MGNDRQHMRRALVALAAAALFTLGLGIVVYVGLARERIVPTPTHWPVPTAVPTSQITQQPSQTPLPPDAVLGIVKSYDPGGLIVVIAPLQGDVEQVIVSQETLLTWQDGERASPREIVVGQTFFAEGDRNPACESVHRYARAAIADAR